MRPLPALLAVALTSACGFLAAAPDWVAGREQLPACGVEDAGMGEGIDEAARTCLFEAYQDGRSAEFISTMTSVEGDDITRYVRVHGDGLIEIFVDATRDRFGSGAWERLVCERLVSVEEFNEPDDAVRESWVFVEDRCAPMAPRG